MSTKDLIRKIAERCTAADEPAEQPDWEDLKKQIGSWDVFERSQSSRDDMSVATFIKYIRTDDIDATLPSVMENLSDTAQQGAESLLKDAGFDPGDFYHTDDFDDLRFTIEEKANFNIEAIYPYPLFIADPNRKLEFFHTNDQDSVDEFIAFAVENGFSEKQAQKILDNCGGSGRGGIAVITEDIKDLFKTPSVSGDKVLYIHDYINGAGDFVIQGTDTITFKDAKELADNIDYSSGRGRYSLGDVFGTDLWKWR